MYGLLALASTPQLVIAKLNWKPVASPPPPPPPPPEMGGGGGGLCQPHSPGLSEGKKLSIYKVTSSFTLHGVVMKSRASALISSQPPQTALETLNTLRL